MFSKTKKILVICPSPEGVAACQRLKYEQYLKLLEKENIRFTISNFQSKRFWKIIYLKGYFLEKVFWTFVGYFRRTYDLMRVPFYDAVFVNLWVTPLGPPLFERLLIFLQPNIIYDIDDLIYLKSADGERPGIIMRLRSSKKPILLMKYAKSVIVCTPHLEKVALGLNKYKKVVDISSTFNTDRFVPREGATLNKDTLIIGWTGSHSTLPFLQSLEAVLKKVAKQRSVKLLVIANKEFSMEGVLTEFIKWTAESEIKDLQNIDIGLYPIPMTEWSLGKSSLKALTYMAIGIPFVATAYGTNFRIMKDGVEGFLASDDKEWEEKLITLIDNPDMRNKMGMAGRKNVIDNYSIQANYKKYLQAMEIF